MWKGQREKNTNNKSKGKSQCCFLVVTVFEDRRLHEGRQDQLWFWESSFKISPLLYTASMWRLASLSVHHMPMCKYHLSNLKDFSCKCIYILSTRNFYSIFKKEINKHNQSFLWTFVSMWQQWAVRLSMHRRVLYSQLCAIQIFGGNFHPDNGLQLANAPSCVFSGVNRCYMFDCTYCSCYLWNEHAVFLCPSVWLWSAVCLSVKCISTVLIQIALCMSVWCPNVDVFKHIA